MATDNQILIIPVGLPDLEVRLLTSMFLLTKSRQRNYAFADNGPDEADILMVNADLEAAVERGQKIQSENPKKIIVYVSQNPALDSQRYHLQRRLTVSKVLQLLDQIAFTELYMVASVSIGEVSDTSHRLEKQLLDETNLHNTLAKPRAIVSGGRRTKKVLVVDDSPTIRRQIELGLLPYRVDIEFAETGEQALKFIALQATSNQTYDLVFLDVVLPGTDGYEVCKSIKRQPHTKKTPVVMMTSKSSPFDRVRGALAGCDAYLTKPVEITTFQDILQKYLTSPSKRTDINHELVKRAYPAFSNSTESF